MAQAPTINSINYPHPGWALVDFTSNDPINDYFTLTVIAAGDASGNYTFGVVSPILITGLDIGTSYAFKLTATDTAGTSAAASMTSTVLDPSSNPDPVTNVAADLAVDVPADSSAISTEVTTSASGSCRVFWDPPANWGGVGPRGYIVTPYIGTTAQDPVWAPGMSRETLVDGLTDGTTYTFQVVAINVADKQSTAVTSPAVTPATAAPLTVPTAAPTALTATAQGSGAVALSWTKVPLSNNGGKHIFQYTITAAANGQPTVTGAPRADQTAGTMNYTLNGLTVGVSYTLSIAAHNMYGDGAAATTTMSVT